MSHLKSRCFRARVTTFCVLAPLLGAACRSTRPAPAVERTVDRSNVSVVVREASFEDSELAARGLGRLEVVVRSMDRPTQVLPEAQVLLRTRRDSLRGATDQRGLARFDSVSVGELELIVRRIGYGIARATIQIKPGCRTDVEAYIALSAIGIAPPPPMPGRVAITTCR